MDQSSDSGPTAGVPAPPGPAREWSRPATASSHEVHVPKAADLVANAIRQRIVTGDLLEGELLPREIDLLSAFKVSRPSLREALRVLESEGFIQIRRGGNGGARVQRPTDEIASRYFGAILQSQQTSLADAFEARTIIEAPAAGLAAANWTDDGLAALRRNIEMAEASFDEPAALWEACNQFHRTVIEVASNTTLRLMSALLDRILDRASCAFAVGEFVPDKPNTPFEQPGVSSGHRTHVKLLELIENRDSVGAEELWRKHLSQSADAVLTAPGAKTVVDLMST